MSAHESAAFPPRDMYQVTDVAETLRRRDEDSVLDLVEGLEQASQIVQGKHETGLESIVSSWRHEGFYPYPISRHPRQNLPRHLLAAGTDAAELFLIDHERRLGEVHERMTKLLTENPGLLFVGRMQASTRGGEYHPLNGFEIIDDPFVVRKIWPVLDGREVIRGFDTTYVDINALPPAATQILDRRQKYLKKTD